MIVVRTNMKEMPKECEKCRYCIKRAHPYKGVVSFCTLLSLCLHADEDIDIYKDAGKSDKCPLLEI